MSEPTWIITESPLHDSSATISGLVDALAKAQAEFPTIPKTQEGKVKGTTEKGTPYEYTYKYADLGDILTACRPILAKHGIAVVQRLRVVGQRLDVETLLLRGDEWMACTLGMQIPAARNSAQSAGGLSTYLKRYSYCAMVGVQAEEDTDNSDHGAGDSDAPRRVESPAAEIEGGITGAQQKKLKDGLSVSGLSLQKLLSACVDEGEEPIRRLQDIPADRMPRAEAAINKALRASEGEA